MNRQEAIQNQIDDIMDTFDFRGCAAMLEALAGCGRPYPESWRDNGEFHEYLLRAAARDCMKAAVKHGYAGHSYFEARLEEGEDDDGPWVRMHFNFGDRNYNDGVSYEK
jgi:hypothetical protein